MNSILKIIFCSLTLGVISSCEKDIPEPDLEPQPFGEVNALINGEKWEAGNYYYHYVNDYIRLSMNKYKDGFRRQNLIITNIPRKTGSYMLNNPSFPQVDTTTVAITDFYTFQSDGDVMGDSYILDTALMSPRLEVTYFEPQTDELKGKFEMAFIRDTAMGSKLDYSMPDTVIFTEGYFHTRASASGANLE